jgi:hypothetical protein
MAINSNELRPTNLVFFDFEQYGILREVTVRELWQTGTYADDRVFPIPITAKILQSKFDFEVSEDTVNAIKSSTGVNIHRMYLPNGTWVLSYKDVKIELPFLHDLQNAWYMLFRNELEVRG